MKVRLGIFLLVVLLGNCSQRNNDMEIFKNIRQNNDKFVWTFDWHSGWNFEDKKEYDFKLDTIKQLESRLESKYRELILNSLQSIFTKDRIRDLAQLTITVDDSKLINKIIVFVNIDGVWKRKFDEKKQPVVLWDGTIEREYIPVPTEELLKVTNSIKSIIGYNSARGDSVTVTNIPCDRIAEFAKEDAAYFHRQKLKTILLFIVSLVTISFIFCLKYFIRVEVKPKPFCRKNNLVV